MTYLIQAKEWLKYFYIVMKGLALGKTVIDAFGKSYAISGNTVRRIGDKRGH